VTYDPSQSFNAIHDVTSALRQFILSQLPTGSTVTLLPPGDSLPEVSGINLYLYRVAENPAFRNRSWPGDRLTPPSDLTALALQLSYLLTPLGTQPGDAASGDDAHTMLGLAMRALHRYPILNDIHLPGAFDADTDLPAYLLQSYEQLKVSLVPVSVDELSRIWATINQPYRLSVAYELSVVEISPEVPPFQGGGIVLTVAGQMIQMAPPQLTAINPTSGPLARVAGSAIVPAIVVLTGTGFLDATRPEVLIGQPGPPAPAGTVFLPIVEVDGQRVDIADNPAPSPTAITVALPTDLGGGPDVAVTVTAGSLVGAPLTYTVTPWLAAAIPVRTSLDTAYNPGETTLTVSGQGFDPLASVVRLDSVTRGMSIDLAAAGSATQLAAALPATLANDTYLVRVVLPGNEVSNSSNLAVIPQVDSPISVVEIPGTPPVHQLTVTGARLAAANVRLIIDGVEYTVDAADIQPTQVMLTLGTLLAPGSHTVGVNVGGCLSRTSTVLVA
jgi:hypothetical protein